MNAFHEAGITYFVPPFHGKEVISACLPVVYHWKHVPTGKTGTHTVYLFPGDVKRFPKLLAYWNRTKEWEYSLTKFVLVVL